MWVSWKFGTFATRSVRNFAARHLNMGSVCQKDSIADVQSHLGFVDTIVADDLVEGGLKEVQIKSEPPISVILSKRQGKLSAIGNKCTHYGAPLMKGSYSVEKGIIRCPWHGACFNISNGDIEDFPGLDSLPKYEVEQQNDGNIRIKGHFNINSVSKRVPKCVMAEHEKSVVIIGGGASAQVCAETLRSRKISPWKGKILMICKEPALPYDRIKLSKALKSSVESLQLRSKEFYSEKEANIETLIGVEAIQVNVEDKKVILDKVEAVPYDYLVLASGGTPRELNIPGHDLNGIYQLRSVSDANKIAEVAKDKKVVVIGSSFIGTEVAAFLSDKAASVNIISRTEFPLETAFGPRIGKFVKTLHESKGVKIISNASVTSLSGKTNDSQNVGYVHLDVQEEPIETDLVILGIGVVPSTNYLKDTNVKRDEYGHVIVNAHLESNIQDIYCAGDISKFPLNLPTLEPDTHAAIGHWQLAQSHGRCIGLNIGLEESEKTSIKTVPFFWTVQYGKNIRYAGYAPKYDDIIYDGVPEEGSFVAYFCYQDQVKAIATLGRDPLAADFANHLLEGKTLTKTEALQGDWMNRN